MSPNLGTKLRAMATSVQISATMYHEQYNFLPKLNFDNLRSLGCIGLPKRRRFLFQSGYDTAGSKPPE